jgi:transposase
MSAAYSLDFRERVMGTVEAGASSRRAAAVFKVSISTEKWFGETGADAPLPSGGDHKSRTRKPTGRGCLLSLVAAGPDLTLEEIRGRLKAAH